MILLKNFLLNFAKEYFITLKDFVVPFFVATFIVTLMEFFNVTYYFFNSLNKINKYLLLIFVSIVGAVIPVCSCSILPFIFMMQKANIPNSVLMAFLISGPAIGIDSIFITYNFFGIKFTIFRVLFLIVLAFLTGFLYHILFEKNIEAGDIKYPKIKLPLKFLWMNFEKNILETADILLVALLISSLVSVLAKGYMTFLLKWDLAFMIIISLVLYVCSVSSIAVAYQFFRAGFSLKSSFVFLTIGPITNISTLTLLYEKLGKKFTYFYMLSVVLFTLLVVNFFNFSTILEFKNTFYSNNESKFYFFVEQISLFLFFFILAKDKLNKFYNKISK